MDKCGQELSGRTALVTGGARRIGRAIAVALGARGAGVVVHYRSSRPEAEETAAAVEEAGGRAWTLDADLEDPAGAGALYDRACEAGGPVDILVNNASVFERGTLGGADVGRLRRDMAVNAAAPLLLARRLASSRERGDVINLLDVRLVGYDAPYGSYQLSKKMLDALTAMMALEFAPGVRVNGVAPGLVLPPAGKGGEHLARLARNNPLGTHGGPEDVVAAVLYLLGAGFVTGQVIFVDGGQHLCGPRYSDA
jgi:NAD(P)-dependent dehydrogenase (short-subunit alcohol dehydrogenase family)